MQQRKILRCWMGAAGWALLRCCMGAAALLDGRCWMGAAALLDGRCWMGAAAWAPPLHGFMRCGMLRYSVVRKR